MLQALIGPVTGLLDKFIEDKDQKDTSENADNSPEKETALSKYCVNLNEKSKKGDIDPLIGRKLEVENNALRKLLSVNEEPSSLVVTARVIADSGGFFVRTLILNAGTSQGVKKGYAVIGSNGLAGRIVEAGTRSSRVLQLSDMNSRIPVMISPYGQRGILVGDNTKRPSLLFLNNNFFSI